MLLLKVFVIFTFIYTIGQCCQENLIQFIKDFLNFKQPPIKLFAFVCWNVSCKVKLIRNLNNHYVSFKSIHKNSLPYEKNHHHMFILDTNCNNYKDILEAANNHLLRAPFRWLIIGGLKTIPEHLNILLDSKFYVAEEKSGSYIIKSLYKVTKYDNHFLQNDVAKWNNGFKYYNELSWAKNRSNLNGLILNTSMALTSAATSVDIDEIWSNRNRHEETEFKVNYRKWNNALFALNAVGNASVAPTWGTLNESTGLFSGMIGDLQTGKADIGGSIAFIVWNRIGIVDYVSPASRMATCFVYRAPALSLVGNVFVLPFNYSVWYASCVLVVIICITIYIIIKWEYRNEFLENLDHKPTIFPNFSDVSVLTFGGICQQGTEAEPTSASGRLAMLISFLALMFLYTAYSANIVAMLQSTSENVNTIEGLLNSKIELGVHDTPYATTYFLNITEPIRKAIYEQKIAPKGKFKYLLDVDEGIKRVREEFFAFHTEPPKAYTIIARTFQENEKCSLREQVWAVSQPYIPVASNSSYKELFKIGLRKVEETGVHDREFKALYLKKPLCQGAGSTFTSVGLMESYFAFYIFGIGCVIALMLLGIEQIVFKKREKIFKVVKKVLSYIYCILRKDTNN